MEKKRSILKLSEHDETKELEFELNYLRSLTFEERLALMRKKSIWFVASIVGAVGIIFCQRLFSFLVTSMCPDAVTDAGNCSRQRRSFCLTEGMRNRY